MSIIDGDMLLRQYNKALDALAGALRDCPADLWAARLWPDEPDQWVAKGFGTFWYLGYHALFWIDLYLTGAEEGFMPPAPFALVEMAANETLPRTYTREELLGYADHCRRQCAAVIGKMSPEAARTRCFFPWGEIAFAELQLYSLRHTEEHAAQLHLFLNQQAAGRPA